MTSRTSLLLDVSINDDSDLGVSGGVVFRFYRKAPSACIASRDALQRRAQDRGFLHASSATSAQAALTQLDAALREVLESCATDLDAAGLLARLAHEIAALNECITGGQPALPQSLERRLQSFDSIFTVLKTRHDTVKNSTNLLR